MSDEGFGFAPPPFKADEALQRLRRRAARPGAGRARQGLFERRGIRIARVAADGAALQAAVRAAALAQQRPSGSRRRAEKQPPSCASFVADLKRKLAAWGDADE